MDGTFASDRCSDHRTSVASEEFLDGRIDYQEKLARTRDMSGFLQVQQIPGGIYRGSKRAVKDRENDLLRKQTNKVSGYFAENHDRLDRFFPTWR